MRCFLTYKFHNFIYKNNHNPIMELWFKYYSNGTATNISKIVSKPITSGSYKTVESQREGNGSTINNQSQYVYYIINST